MCYQREIGKSSQKNDEARLGISDQNDYDARTERLHGESSKGHTTFASLVKEGEAIEEGRIV